MSNVDEKIYKLKNFKKQTYKKIKRKYHKCSHNQNHKYKINTNPNKKCWNTIPLNGTIQKRKMKEIVIKNYNSIIKKK